MDCKDFGGLLGSWMDNMLDERTRNSMDVHDKSCAECRQLHEVRQSLRNIVRGSNADEQVPQLLARILESVRRPGP